MAVPFEAAKVVSERFKWVVLRSDYIEDKWLCHSTCPPELYA